MNGLDLADLGEHRLRDLSGVEHLFQVRADGLGLEFPGLKTLNAVPGNLPMQATSFVGRGSEITDLVALVRAHRLVTLTGVGGVGKTRLALQVAAELVPDFEDGVWLEELAPVGDPAAVPDAVATALGITAQPGMSVTAGVAHGDLDDGLVLFDDIIDSFHQAGNLSHLTFTLLDLVIVLDRFQRYEVATALYGTTTHHDGALRPLPFPMPSSISARCSAIRASTSALPRARLWRWPRPFATRVRRSSWSDPSSPRRRRTSRSSGSSFEFPDLPFRFRAEVPGALTVRLA